MSRRPTSWRSSAPAAVAEMTPRGYLTVLLGPPF
jgi:hypothetical protein